MAFKMNNMSDIFNNISQNEKENNNNFDIIFIDIDDLVINENNKYQIKDIDTLMTSIENFGILQNLEVEKLENGKYKIIGGERRYTAVKNLVEQGKVEFKKVPCRIVEYNNVTLKNAQGENIEIDIDLLKKWRLRTTNEEQRKKTEQEILMEINEQKELYEYLKNKGIEFKGKKRDIIANEIGISASQLQRYEFVEKNLDDELKNKFKQGDISLATAIEVAKTDKETQQKIKEKIQNDNSISLNDINNIKEKENINKKNIISEKEINKINNLVKEINKIIFGYKVLDNKNYNNYLKSTEKIIKELEKVYKIINK